MSSELPPTSSLVCVDNTIVFKAVYNPASVVTDLFSVLILERSCTLYSTEKNLHRCQEAVERKVLVLIKKLLEERDPNVEHLRRYSLILDVVGIARGKAGKGKRVKNNQGKMLRAFTDELVEQIKAFLDQRLEFVRSFLNVKDFDFYKRNFTDAISILGDREPEHEDAHILALALTLYEEHNIPVYLWTDDSDFHNIEPVIKRYGVIPFKKIEG